MRGTAFGCVTMPLIAAIGILGCTAGRMAERAQPDVGAARYVLRWEECAEPAEGRARASQWSCHEITSQEGRRAVAAWLEANRESMHPPNGMIPLPYSPAKELFCFQDDGTCQFWELRFWDIRRHVRPVSALRNWSKAELLQVNWSPNLPVQQFIALQDVFRRHGRPVEPNEDLDRIRDKHAAPSLVPDQGRFVLLSRQEETSPPNEWAVWAIDDEEGRQAVTQWILANYEALKCADAVSRDLAVFAKHRLFWFDARQPDNAFDVSRRDDVPLLPYIPVVRKGGPDGWEWVENLPVREIAALGRLFRRYGKPTAFDPSWLNTDYQSVGLFRMHGKPTPAEPSSWAPDHQPHVRFLEGGTVGLEVDAGFSAGPHDMPTGDHDAIGGWYVLRWEERQGPPDDSRAASRWLCYVLDDVEGRRVVKQWIKANRVALSVPQALPHLRVAPSRQLACWGGEMVLGGEWVWNLWLTAPEGSPNRPKLAKLDLPSVDWTENLPMHEFERIKGIFSKYGRAAPPNRADLTSLLGPAQDPPASILDGGSFVLRVAKSETGPYEWANYRIDDDQGRRAVEDWIALNYEALVCAEVSQTWNPPRAIPPRELYWFNDHAKTRLEMEGRTFISRGHSENCEHMDMLTTDQCDNLLRIFKAHGKVVDFDPRTLVGQTYVPLKE